MGCSYVEYIDGGMRQLSITVILSEAVKMGWWIRSLDQWQLVSSPFPRRLVIIILGSFRLRALRGKMRGTQVHNAITKSKSWVAIAADYFESDGLQSKDSTYQIKAPAFFASSVRF